MLQRHHNGPHFFPYPHGRTRFTFRGAEARPSGLESAPPSRLRHTLRVGLGAPVRGRETVRPSALFQPNNAPGPACQTRTGHVSDGPVESSDSHDAPVIEAHAAAFGRCMAVEPRHKLPASVVG